MAIADRSFGIFKSGRGRFYIAHGSRCTDQPVKKNNDFVKKLEIIIDMAVDISYNEVVKKIEHVLEHDMDDVKVYNFLMYIVVMNISLD